MILPATDRLLIAYCSVMNLEAVSSAKLIVGEEVKSARAELTLTTNSLAVGNLCKCLILSQGEWEVWGSQVALVEVGGD